MKLSRVHIKNFRCFIDEEIEFCGYNTFIGPNNVGKSTILRALDIFFNSGKNSIFSNEDFNVDADPQDFISIEVEFADVVGDAALELKHYVRNDKLLFEIIGRRTETSITSNCRGIRYGLQECAPFFAASGATAKRAEYEKLQSIHPGVFAQWQSATVAEDAVRNFEASKPADHIKIPSNDSAYGATGPLPILRKFVEWIYVPAVKDASTEAFEQRNSAFSKLIQVAIRNRYNYKDKLEKLKAETLKEFSAILSGADFAFTKLAEDIKAEILKINTYPIDIGLDWNIEKTVEIQDPFVQSYFKDGEVIDVPENFGHGLQRTYLMALLSLAAQVQETDNFRDLIIAVEEPELYQHPPQTRYLSAALQELARSKTQMLVTTHSPYFVNGAAFDGIKLLQKFKNSVHIQTNSLKRHAEEFSRIKNVKEIGGSAFLSGMDKTLETSAAEMFFGRKIVFVESVEDIAIIESYLINTKKWIDFLRAGGHFIAAFGKPKMPYLIALAHSYKIEHYTVFDIDLDKKNSPNDEIIRFSKISPHHLPDTLTAEFNNECYYGFEHDIQKSILRDHPSWHPIREQIANEWGWSLERMDKDPMLLRAAVDKLFETDGDIKPLAQLAQRLENFWAK